MERKFPHPKKERIIFMTEFYKLFPEVPGQLGEKTQMDTTSDPPTVRYLHFIFDGWLGDDLIECFPCYLITTTFLKRLLMENLSGFDIEAVEIGYSEVFKELYPNRKLPEFKWLKINGQIGNDFFLRDKCLIVSKKVLKIFEENGNIRNCEIEKIVL